MTTLAEPAVDAKAPAGVVPQPKDKVPAAQPEGKRWAVDVSFILRMIAIVIIGVLLQIVFVSQLQHSTAQHEAYDKLRLTLAEGSVPVGPTATATDGSGTDAGLTPLGTPVALLEVPALNLSEVIVEGTTSAQTAAGVGHQRDTPMPGQTGTSVLMGRSGAYGGVFGQLKRLDLGEKFTVTTGQGRSTYEVIGFRRAGDTEPPKPKAKEGRITLITADGDAFLPDGVLHVDAKLVSDPAAKPAQVIRAGSIPDSEKPMGSDTSGLIGLVMLLELVIAATVAAVWCWKRWGKWKTWIVFAPLLTALGLLAATPISYLLPNLL